MIDYIKESDKYKPKIIKELLIGEAPPPSGKKYFYIPIIMSNKKDIEKDTSLPATIFYHYFNKRPETIDEYINFLNKLKNMGVFLIDIIDESLKIRDKNYKNGINTDNLRILMKHIQMLRNKIKSRGIDIDDKNMIFLLPRKHYKKELKKEFPKAKFKSWKEFRLNGK